MDYTVVSMTTLSDGRTGNMVYKDGRVPSDEDLLEVARKYKMEKDVKVTITFPSKVKEIFVGDIVNDEWVKRDAWQNTRSAYLARMMFTENEMEKLKEYDSYLSCDVKNLCERKNVDYNEVVKTVEEYRKSKWEFIPENMYTNMLLYCFTEVVCKKVFQLDDTAANRIISRS